MSKITIQEQLIEQIGAIIVDAWYQALPKTTADPRKSLDQASLSAAFTNLLGVTCVAVLDSDQMLNIVVPYLDTDNFKTKSDFEKYLHKHFQDSNDPNDAKNPFNPSNKHHQGLKQRTFARDIGDATIFGCGR